MMTTKFAQIPQQDAAPDIAAVYADIRAVSGAPVVNLIWRHFAALPGVLPWAWDALSPVIGSAGMAAARPRIAAAVTLPPIPPGRDAWRRAGVGDEDLRRLAVMVDAYVRGNLTNIVALTALRAWLEEPGRRGFPLAAAPAAPEAPAPLDPLPRIEAVETAVAERIRALAARHDGAGEGVIPSLYLELARWPGVIEALPGWLAPLYEPVALRAARASACRLAETEALSLRPRPSPPPVGVAAMQPALEDFTRVVIPDLTAICIALRRLVPAP